MGGCRRTNRPCRTMQPRSRSVNHTRRVQPPPTGGFLMSKTKRIAVDGVLAALYFALSALTFTVGNLQLRFTSLALIMAARFSEVGAMREMRSTPYFVQTG